MRRVVGRDRATQSAEVRARHRPRDCEASDEVLRQVELEVGARQDVGVRVLDRLLIEGAERGRRNCPRDLRTRFKRAADSVGYGDVHQNTLLGLDRAHAEVAAPALSFEIRHRVYRPDFLPELEFARPVTTHHRITIRVQVAPALEFARREHPGLAREVSTDTAGEVARVSLAVPLGQVRRIERISREVGTLCHLLGIAVVLRATHAELEAFPRTHSERIQAVELPVRFLVLGFRGTRAEDPVERRAGEVGRIAVRERHVSRR